MASRYALIAALAVCLVPAVHAKIFTHQWGTVADVMGMHGKFKATPSDDTMAFIAKNYAGMSTIGTGCLKGQENFTMEDATIAAGRKIKAANPEANVGMYYRSDMALELADCSPSSAAWNAHPEWWLKDDKGNYVTKNGKAHQFDFSNPACAAFFTSVYRYVLDKTLPSGKPVINYMYMDGAGCSKTEYAPGIGAARSDAICTGKMNMIATLQAALNAEGAGQNLILNGMDTPTTADLFVPTGAAGAMFDHWTILQYLNRTTGKFLLNDTDAAFTFAKSKQISNITIQIKGWVGPIIKQRDQYPALGPPQPKTPADFQKVAGERFNSELAFFLLVAEESHFWLYSWFWGWDDWIPGQPDSTIPTGFYPEAKCQLGAPLGPSTRVGGSWTYTRKYEYADVFVDLTNRTASRVDFKGTC